MQPLLRCRGRVGGPHSAFGTLPAKGAGYRAPVHCRAATGAMPVATEEPANALTHVELAAYLSTNNVDAALVQRADIGRQTTDSDVVKSLVLMAGDSPVLAVVLGAFCSMYKALVVRTCSTHSVVHAVGSLTTSVHHFHESGLAVAITAISLHVFI